MTRSTKELGSLPDEVGHDLGRSVRVGCGSPAEPYAVVRPPPVSAKAGATRVNRSRDVVSQGASGAVRADLGGTEVSVAFAESAEEAEKAVANYKLFGQDDPSFLVVRDRNAVMAWQPPPTDKQRATVEGCLSE